MISDGFLLQLLYSKYKKRLIRTQNDPTSQSVLVYISNVDNDV